MIKKFTLFLTLTSLLATLFTCQVFADEAPTVTLGSGSGETGELVSIPVTLSKAVSFANFGIEIGYDSNALAIKEVTPINTGALFVPSQNFTENPYKLTYNSTTNTVMEGTVAVITFEIITEFMGDYEITVDFDKGRNGTYQDGKNVNYDENFVPLGLSYSGGKITVTGDGKPEPITVTVGNATGIKGDFVSIPVVLSENRGFANLGIEIGYDSEALRLTNVEASAEVKATYSAAKNLTVNPYNMTWYSNTNTDFNGTLATLTFEIITHKTGEYPVTVDYYKGRNGNFIDGININYDKDFEAVKLVYASGSVIKVTGFDAEFSGDTNVGTVWAALYDENNVLQCVKSYQPSDRVKVAFDKEVTGTYAKVMWWNDNMKPLCNEKIFYVE